MFYPLRPFPRIIQTMATEDGKANKAREQIAKSTLVIGQLAKDPREAITAAAQAAAGLIRGDGAAIFAKVFDNLAKKGDIDPRFGNSSKSRYFIQEINDVLSGNIRDEQMLLTKIQLFIAIASNTYKSHSEDEAKEVWNIVKALNSKDIKVLATSYRLWKDNKKKQSIHYTSVNEWIDYIAKESGLKYSEFIDESRNILQSKRLFTQDYNTDYLLSPLGICVAGYLYEGERLFALAPR